MRISKFNVVKEAVVAIFDLFLKVYSVFRNDKVKDDLNDESK